MAYENPQFDRLKQTIDNQQTNTSRFGSTIADLLQKNNKSTDSVLTIGKAATSQMSQYFQTTIKLQTESNSILREIAEILSKSSTTKNNQSLIGAAAKQGINFDISKEQPKKGFISNMWQASAKVAIDKEIKKSNRKLSKSLGLSMTLATAMTTPASARFRGIVAESEMDFNVVNTNILLGQYELQRLSLQQLVDINKYSGSGAGKTSASGSISKHQIKAERQQTDNFKHDFDQNADPRTMMQKIGGIPLVGGYLQMLTAPIKELLTLQSLPLRIKKGWNEFKDKTGLAGSPTASLKRTGLYKSDQDRAYSFLGGDFIKIIENIRADAAAIRYQVTGEKPGTDPKTGKRLDQSRAEIYDAIKGEFYAAKRDKSGRIVKTAEQTRDAVEKRRQDILDEDIRANLSMTGEILQGFLNSGIGKAIFNEKRREKLGIETVEEQAQKSVSATRVAELAKVENAELRYRIQMNDKLPEAIKRMDELSVTTGLLGSTITGVIATISGAAAPIAGALGIAGGAVALYKASKSIKEEGYIEKYINSELKYEKGKKASDKVREQLKANEAGANKNSLAGLMGSTLSLPEDIKDKISEFTRDIHTIAGFLEKLADERFRFAVDIIQDKKQADPVKVSFDKKDQKMLPHVTEMDSGGNISKGRTAVTSEKKRGGTYSLEYVSGLGLTAVPTLVAGPASITGAGATEDALRTTAISTKGLLQYFQLRDKQDRDISISEQINAEKAQDLEEKRDKVQETIADVLVNIQKDQEDQTDFLKDTEKKRAKPVKKGFFESIFGGLSFLKGLGSMLLPLIPTILGSVFSVGMGGIVGPIMTGVISFLTKHIAGGALGLAFDAAGGIVKKGASAAGSAIGAAGSAIGKGVGAAAGMGAKGLGAVAGKVAGPLAILIGAIEMISDFKETGNVGEAIFGNMKKGGLGDALKGMSKYAAMGAVAGMIGGPPGMAMGALIGSAIGGIIGWFGTDKISAALGNAGDIITKMNSSIADFFTGSIGGRAGSWAKQFESSNIPIVMPLIGGILGGAVDGLGFLWTKLKDVASGVPDLIHYANYKISDFFTGDISSKLAGFGAEHGVPIISPLMGGLVGSIADLFVNIFKPASAEFQKVEGVSNLADQGIVQAFDKLGRYSREGAVAGANLIPIPILGSLIGGIFGSAVQLISFIFGEKTVQDLLGDTNSLNNGVVNIFKALGSDDTFGTKWAEKGKDGVPILGPLVGGLAGTIVDILAWFIPDSWKRDISNFGDRAKAAWDSMMIDFQEMYNSLLSKIQNAISKTNSWLSGKRKGIANWASEKAAQPGSSKVWSWIKNTTTSIDERGAADAAAANNWLESKKAEVASEKEALAKKDADYDARQKEHEDEKSKLYEKFDKKENILAGVPENSVKKDIINLAKSTTNTVKDVSTGLIKTSLKVGEEIESNSIEFKDQALDGINWLGNSIFVAFKSMGAMFLGIVQKLSGWFKENAPDYYEKNIKPALESAGSALRTGGEYVTDFTKETAIPALSSAASAVKDFTVNTAIPAIKRGASVVGSSVATGASIAGEAIGGVATNIGNLSSDIATRAKKWVAKGWSNKYNQESRDAIIKAAANQKVPEDYLFGMAMIESQGDPNARTPSGTYKGLFQFGPPAWKTYGSGDPYDPEANALAGAKYMRHNIAVLKKAGIPITLGNLYLAHQQGEGGVVSLNRLARSGGEPSGSLRKHMDSNSGKGLNASSFLNMWGYITENLKQKAYKLRNAFKGGSATPADSGPPQLSSSPAQTGGSTQETPGGVTSNSSPNFGLSTGSVMENTFPLTSKPNTSTPVTVSNPAVQTNQAASTETQEPESNEQVSNDKGAVKGLTFAPGVDPGIGQAIASKVKQIQSRYGKQLLITSGYRSPARNKAVGGAKSSLHMRRMAVDIKTGHLPRSERLKLIKIADSVGIGGIGVYSNDLHFDVGNKRAWGPSYSRSSLPSWAAGVINERTGGGPTSTYAQGESNTQSGGLMQTSYTPTSESTQSEPTEGGGSSTNLIQSATNTIGKLASYVKGGADSIYDSFNLGQYGFKLPSKDSIKSGLSTAGKAISTGIGIAKSSIATGAGIVGNAISSALSYFQSAGWNKDQAAGIVASLNAESKLNPGAVGDGGKAYGIAQWHPDRQANFQSVFGKSIKGSSLEEQLAFVNYELTQGTEQKAGSMLRSAKSAQEAGAIVSKYYERPADVGGQAAVRAAAAGRLASGGGADTPAGTPTYTPSADNQSPQTPEEGNQGGLIQNAMNYVADLARKAEAVGNANREKQGRAPVQSLVNALGLEKYGFKDSATINGPTGTSVAGVSNAPPPKTNSIKRGSIKRGLERLANYYGITVDQMANHFGITADQMNALQDDNTEHSSQQGGTVKGDLTKHTSTPYISSKYSEITNIPKATQEQRDHVAKVNQHYADEIKKLGIEGSITPQQMRLLAQRSATGKGKDAENLPGYQEAKNAYIEGMLKRNDPNASLKDLSDEQRARLSKAADHGLSNIKAKEGMSLEELSASEAKYDVAMKAIDAEKAARTTGLNGIKPTYSSRQTRTAAEDQAKSAKDPGLFGTIGTLLGDDTGKSKDSDTSFIADTRRDIDSWLAKGEPKNINQPTFKTKDIREALAEPTPQVDQPLTAHSSANSMPITVGPTQRGPTSRQSSNVEHRTTVEEINPSRFDPEVDELVWKLFTTVPDIFKKDANLFGTGIMF
jgi:hypothetical protein